MKRDRRTYLGGADIAGICGVSPYQTPLDVWSRKVADINTELDSYAIRKGLALETVLLDEAEKYLGFMPGTLARDVAVSHPDYDYFGGTVDAYSPMDDVVVEAKTVSNSVREKYWLDGPPMHYQIQLYWYMMLTGHTRGVLVADLGDPTPSFFEYKREETIEQLMMSNAKLFWEKHVLTKIPPKIDGSQLFAEAMTQVYPRDKKEYVEMDNGLLTEYNDVTRLINDKTKHKMILRNKIINGIGAFAGGKSEQFIASWNGVQLRVKECSHDY